MLKKRKSCEETFVAHMRETIIRADVRRCRADVRGRVSRRCRKNSLVMQLTHRAAVEWKTAQLWKWLNFPNNISRSMIMHNCKKFVCVVRVHSAFNDRTNVRNYCITFSFSTHHVVVSKPYFCSSSTHHVCVFSPSHRRFQPIIQQKKKMTMIPRDARTREALLNANVA